MKFKIENIFIFFLFLFFTVSFVGQPKPKPYIFTQINYFPEMPITSDNPVTIEGRELGRFLFYDPILSADSSVSCATCHQQKFAFSDAPNKFSRGINGDLMKRNTMPIFNLAWYSALFWDGKAKTIESQVFEPVKAHDEMNLDWSIATERIAQSNHYTTWFELVFENQIIDSNLIVKAIAQFERTLISANSKFDKVLRGEVYLTADEYEGYGLINDQTKGNCLHCHITDGNGLGTTGLFSNNGLEAAEFSTDYLDLGLAGTTKDLKHVGQFKIPSLRNLAFTPPYMHDGRFATLMEVLDFYSDGVNNSFNIDSKMAIPHNGEKRLTDNEKEKIIAFLLTLTDSSFINNPLHSNPFIGE